MAGSVQFCFLSADLTVARVILLDTMPVAYGQVDNGGQAIALDTV